MSLHPSHDLAVPVLVPGEPPPRLHRPRQPLVVAQRPLGAVVLRPVVKTVSALRGSRFRVGLFAADLIIWERAPRIQDSAIEVSDADLMNCKPTLDTWKAGEPTGPGYCSKIARASDNPGYDTDVRPAPPLNKVIDEVGDC
jgi:hypothetical protein